MEKIRFFFVFLSFSGFHSINTLHIPNLPFYSLDFSFSFSCHRKRVPHVVCQKLEGRCFVLIWYIWAWDQLKTEWGVGWSSSWWLGLITMIDSMNPENDGWIFFISLIYIEVNKIDQMSPPKGVVTSLTFVNIILYIKLKNEFIYIVKVLNLNLDFFL